MARGSLPCRLAQPDCARDVRMPGQQRRRFPGFFQPTFNLGAMYVYGNTVSQRRAGAGRRAPRGSGPARRRLGAWGTTSPSRRHARFAEAFAARSTAERVQPRRVSGCRVCGGPAVCVCGRAAAAPPPQCPPNCCCLRWCPACGRHAPAPAAHSLAPARATHAHAVPQVRAKEVKRVCEARCGWLCKRGLTNTGLQRRW